MTQPTSATEQTPTVESTDRAVQFSCDASRGFTGWLSDRGASLVISTYQVGKLIFVGLDPEGKLWIHNRNLGRCLGLTAAGRGFWASSDTQLYYFHDLLHGTKAKGGEDACYAPRLSYFTGDLDAHDVGVDARGEPVFANTLFNCLARPSLTASFEPVWRPEFISALVAEDRCHLNGLAMREGKPAYVTAISETDTYDGWREHRSEGGVVIEVATGKVVCRGLSMPHSPRWHEGRLWLHNSGTGELGYVDTEAQSFKPVAFCPGYLRGLDFMGDFAVVGLSLPRDNKTFSGLALDAELSKRKISPKCGVYFIDTRSGSIVHSLNFGGLVTELYDVVVLEGVRQPSAMSPLNAETKRAIAL